MFWDAVLTVLTCSQGLLIAATKRTNNTYSYSTLAANLSVEVFKIFASFVLAVHALRAQDAPITKSMLLPLKKVVAYAVPALLYMIKNLLQYVVMEYVEAPSYQILKNLNVLTTATFYCLILKKKVSKLEWCSLTLMTIGCVVSQLENDSNAVMQISTNGLLLSMIMALLSSFAGVYTELVMKSEVKRDVNVQNLYMYSFGILFNVATFRLPGFQLDAENGVLHGFTPLVWLMILNHAFAGIAVSYVMKYNNNLNKVKATSLAMALTTLISVIFLGYTLKIQFLLGFATVAISLFIPTLEKDLMQKAPNRPP